MVLIIVLVWCSWCVYSVCYGSCGFSCCLFVGFAVVGLLLLWVWLLFVTLFRFGVLGFVCLAGGLWSLVWLLTCGVVCLLVVRLCVWLNCDGFGVRLVLLLYIRFALLV